MEELQQVEEIMKEEKLLWILSMQKELMVLDITFFDSFLLDKDLVVLIMLMVTI